jgi:hypothetical protein
VGSVLVSSTAAGNGPFAAALVTLVVIALVGLGAALLLPPSPAAPATENA